MDTNYRELVRAAQGQIPCDLLLTNTRLINVHTGEIQENTNIGIHGSKIAYIGREKLPAKTVLNAEEKYAIPGLIDTHLHIESSQVTPPRFAEAVVPKGTTTAAIDPHEIANVMGLEGVRLMLESSKTLPLRVFVMAPTCVPSVEALETAGAEFTSTQIEEMLTWNRVIGLAEIMDYDAVIHSQERMLAIIDAGRRHDAILDGHCMFLEGGPLEAYLSTGIEACHENFTPEAAIAKLRGGIDYVKIRNPKLMSYQFPGPMEEYVKNFVTKLTKIPDKRSVLFCTDDIMPDTLVDQGHLDDVLRTVITYGYDPIEAIQGATIGAANHLRLHELGSITPGKYADIILLGTALEKFIVDTVITNGEVVAKNGKMLKPIDIWWFPERSKNTVKLQVPNIDEFLIKAPIENGTITVRTIDMASIMTQFSNEQVEVKKSVVQTMSLTTLTVFERHGRFGNKCIGLAKNALDKGAIASTVSHDSHNLVVMGRNARDMQLAAQNLIETQGGVVVVDGGVIKAKVSLPVAGLMSEEPIEVVARQMRETRQALRELGRDERGFLSIWSITLPVVPSARITDKFLVDTDRQEPVELFVN